jgi:hypothetical protein
MSEEFAILLVQEGDSPRTSWELHKETMVIGRGEDCDIVINNRQVSRYHSKIVRQNDQYKLIDMDSKNGTFLNGVQVTSTPQPLKDGDQIGVALNCRLVFVDAGATAPLFMETPYEPGIKMDWAAKRVWVAGKELDPPLSLAQYKLLELLFSYKGGVVSRDEIVSTVWSGEEAEGVSEQAIDALARRLRERIAEVDPDTQYIVTVRGHGFRLENFIE